MNYSSISGITLAIVVLIATMVTSVKDMWVFLDYHAAMIVLGGTLAAALTAFSATKMWNMMKVVLSRVIKTSMGEYAEVIDEIVDLGRGYRENPRHLEESLDNIKTHFLKEAVQLTVEGGLSPKDIDMILLKRAQTHHKRYEEDANVFHTLAKFPPAFGLLGAVVGMIALMQSLGGADAIKNVGPAMAVALVATMYGIAFANFILIPLGENLSKHNRTDKIIRTMVLDGIKLIRAKKHPLLIEENIKSYLLPSERDALNKMTGSGGGDSAPSEAA